MALNHSKGVEPNGQQPMERADERKVNMAMTMLDCERRYDMEIPSTAVRVKVHNIVNPHSILVSDVKESSIMLDQINMKLQATVRRLERTRKIDQTGKLQPGMVAIVRRESTDQGLPAWYCRAIVGSMNEKNLKYNAFFPDYGEHVQLNRESFIAMPKNFPAIPYVTFFIGLYKIWPLGKRLMQGKKKYELVCQQNWSSECKDVIMQLLGSASKCYFDQITIKKCGKQFGELYLIIDNQIVALSKALIIAQFAVDIIDLMSRDDTSSSQLTSSEQEDDIFEFDDSSAPFKAKRNIYHEILVSSNVECERLNNNINEAGFDAAVMRALAGMNINHIRRIQSYVWPAINKGLDVLSVGPSKSGKTIGYTAPIASILVHTKKYQQDSSHPMVLVLCSSSNDGRCIESHFKGLLAAHPDIKIIGAFNGCSDRSLSALIYSGCHVLISTPAFLVRFFDRSDVNRKLLRLDSISHLIIDSLDVVMERHKMALTHLLAKYTLVGKKQSRSSTLLALQVVATARNWTTDIGTFVKIFRNPYICIGSFAEAAIFCGAQLRPRMVCSDQKKTVIAQILEKHYKVVKTIIVCAESEEAEELNAFLAPKFPILYVPNEMSFIDVKGMKTAWDTSYTGQYSVMICTDTVLPGLQINDAAWLIHYSIAVPTKSIFLHRFSTLMSNLKNNTRKVEVTILIDSGNDVQLRGIMDLITRSGYILSPKQLQAVERVYVTLERQKKGHPICNNIKALGNCPKRSKCLYRHCVLADVDKPITPVKIGDRIKFAVTYVHNATHFSARITEYIDEDNQPHELSVTEHMKITNDVFHHFSDKRNRRIAQKVVIGGIYAFEETFDSFKRAQVINISGKNADDEIDFVDLRYIDNGNVINRIKASRLREMPTNLAEAPAHIVEIFLANISPYDDENEWNKEATEACMEWFHKEQAPHVFLQAKVSLHLSNTLWVDSLESRTKIIGRREIVSSSLKHHLIKEKHGIENPRHMAQLRELCVNAGMTFEDTDDSIRE